MDLLHIIEAEENVTIISVTCINIELQIINPIKVKELKFAEILV